MSLIYKHARVSKVHERNGDRTISGIITRESVDEDGEVLVADGLDTDYHDRLRGVSIIWNHDTDVPIGKVRDMKRVEDGWQISGFLSEVAKGTEALTLAREGILHWSHGFVRLEAGPPTQQERAKYPGVKMVTRKWRIMEVTLTPIPAHADTTVVVKALKDLCDRKLIRASTYQEFAGRKSIMFPEPDPIRVEFNPLAVDFEG